MGWTEIKVWVRDDLAGDQVAIDRAHIDANRTRRQLGPLDNVRLARRLAELELGRKPGNLGDGELKTLCGRVAEKMGISSRHAQRLLNIACIPMPIQRAYSSGQLKLVDADQVSRLDGRVQRRIAEAIEAGGDPAEIVAPHLVALKRPVKPEDAYERLIAELDRGLDALEGREEQVRTSSFGVEGELQLFERFDGFHRTVATIRTRRLEKYRCDVEEFIRERGPGGAVDE